MGYSTEFTITADEPGQLDKLDRLLGAAWGINETRSGDPTAEELEEAHERAKESGSSLMEALGYLRTTGVSYYGACDERKLYFSGKFYDYEEKMKEASDKIMGVIFTVTGVGEEAYIPSSLMTEGAARVDIWRQFFLDGEASEKFKAEVKLPTPDEWPE